MTLDEALDAYWAAAYAEGQRGATHDAESGLAQTALNAVRSCVRLGIAAEREACKAQVLAAAAGYAPVLGRAQNKEFEAVHGALRGVAAAL